MIITFSLIFTGCSASYIALFGIKNLKPLDEKSILKYALKFNIPPEDNFELDTIFASFILSHDTSQYGEQMKNHLQPLQALYFDRTGRLHSFHVNCYAGGFPNLNWNWNGSLNQFPPGELAPPDTLLPLNIQLNFLKPLSFSSTFYSEEFDYLIFVYWSRFMGRQSRILIHSIQNNCKLAKHEKVKIIYVNNDNLFSHLGLEKD
jgi:hypothetical protein